MIHLPVEFEGVELALAGTLNNWDNSANRATVQHGELEFAFADLDPEPLDAAWQDAPAGANLGFAFVEPGSWARRITGNYGSNDNNFRVTLVEGVDNQVLVDAQYALTQTPPLELDMEPGKSAGEWCGAASSAQEVRCADHGDSSAAGVGGARASVGRKPDSRSGRSTSNHAWKRELFPSMSRTLC